MRPNHHQFEAFAYVVREGSFSAAATRLGVTQSTITQHIAKLEKSVGTLLLVRGRDGVELTPAGQDFYDLADRMVALDAEVSERLEGFNAMKRGQAQGHWQRAAACIADHCTFQTPFSRHSCGFRPV